MNEKVKKAKEEVTIVLDVLPHGYAFDTHRRGPIVQTIGKENFTLLEIVPKRGVEIKPLEEIYIGPGKREKAHHILGRITIDKLTPGARAELENVLRNLIKAQEARFVKFFNVAAPLGIRMHQLELLPGIGKKSMWEILEKRAEKPFESFKDMEERLKGFNPVEAILKRILLELSGKEKHNLFVDV